MESSRLRPLAATEILDGAFTLYRRHFTTFVATAFLPMLPALALMPVGRLLGQIAQVAGSVLAMGAIVHQASEAWLGRQPQLGDGLKVGLARFFPLLIGMVAYMLIVGAGFVLLIVPGICLFCMLFAWEPIVVIEKRMNYFGRSRALARNQWGKISGVMFVALVIAFLPGIALNLSAMSILNVGYVAASNSLLVLLGSAITGALVAPFSHAVYVLLYYDQRVRKEGLDVQLAVEAMDAGQPAAAAVAARPSGR